MNTSHASTGDTMTVALPDRLNIELPETNDRVAEVNCATETRDNRKSIANGRQDSDVVTENRVPELTIDTLVESRFRISRYPNSRFWAVYDGDDLVAVTLYRRGAEEVRRRLQAAADLERLINASGGRQQPGSRPVV